VDHQVVTVSLGDLRYEDVIGQVRADTALRAQIWADAEHELEEQPGKLWTVALVWQEDRWVPAAWCAVRAVDGVLVCSDNYERRGPGRALGLYRAAYEQRHTTIIEPTPLPAMTYLFAEPIPLHEADGWYRTGLSGTSRRPGIHPHDWWELCRRP
jgi:hypothetical protein